MYVRTYVYVFSSCNISLEIVFYCFFSGIESVRSLHSLDVNVNIPPTLGILLHNEVTLH